MTLTRDFFYCYNDKCLGWFQGKGRRLLADCAQELDDKRLCSDCYEAGFRLKRGIICQLVRKVNAKT